MRSLARVVAAILAAALAAVAVLVLVELVNAAAGGAHVLIPYGEWYRFARGHDWTSSELRAVAAGLAVLGAFLLWLGLAPWRPATLDAYDDGTVRVRVKRGAVAQSVRRAVEQIDGIDHCNVRVSPANVRVRATTGRHVVGGLEEAVERAARNRVGELGLPAGDLRARVVTKASS